MANVSQGFPFPLGEKGYRMVTVTSFTGDVKIHIRLFYVNEKGETRAGRVGISLTVEEFENMVNLIPQVKNSTVNMTQSSEKNIKVNSIQILFPVIEDEVIFPDLRTIFLPSPQSQDIIQFTQ